MSEQRQRPPFPIPFELRVRGEVMSDELADTFSRFNELIAARTLQVQFLNPAGEAIDVAKLLSGEIERPRTATQNDFADYGKQLGIDRSQSAKNWHTLARRFYYRSIGSGQEEYRHAQAVQARSLIYPVVFETFIPKQDYAKSTVTDLNIDSLGTYLKLIEARLKEMPARKRLSDTVGSEVGPKMLSFWGDFYRYWRPDISGR